MKKLYTLIVLVAVAVLGATAQSLRVWDATKYVSWLHNANSLQAPMAFDGNTITIEGNRYELNDNVTISYDNIFAEYLDTPEVVHVNFDPSFAPYAYVPGWLKPYVTFSIDAKAMTVDVTVADNLERELTFVLSGKGSSFALHGNYKTTVVLNGIELNATGKTPALWIDNGKRIEFQVNEGTTNSFADAAANEKKSAFFVKGHAEWKGAGTVNVTGTSRHAYSSNEYTKFKASFTGTFNVTAAGSDAMHIDQYLEVNGGIFNLSGMQGDGIDVACALEDNGITKTQDEFNGQFLMNGGTINVTAAGDDTKGIKCEDTMTITAGRVNATANGAGSRGVQAGTDLILGTEGVSATGAYLYLTATGGKYEFTNEDGLLDSNKCRGLKVKRNFTLYPATVERGKGSTVTAKNLIDVDGTYKNLGGTLVDCYIQ